MSGIEVMDALKSSDDTAGTSIVVFSGAASEKYPWHRADAWVMKPSDPSHLLAVVRKAGGAVARDL